MSTAPLSRIALYYRFTPLADPEAVRLWQRTLAASLGLTGRIIVSPQGINGTVGGPVDAVKRYVRGTREHPAFRDLEVKWSDGSAADFPRLSVKLKPELVAFGAGCDPAIAPGQTPEKRVIKSQRRMSLHRAPFCSTATSQRQ